MSGGDAPLTRGQAIEYIRSKGFPIGVNMLALYATIGGGPIYSRWGNKTLYRVSDLDAWINSKLQWKTKASA